MKKLIMALGVLAVLVQPVLAFAPAGWVYCSYPWAYDSVTGDWYWFNTSDTQWIVNMGSGQWATLDQSALASGWVYSAGNGYLYAKSNSAWHWVNDADPQWVVNMRTGEWTRLGVAASLSLANLAGTWVGTNSFGENISAILASDGSFSFTVPNGTSTGILSLSGSHVSGTYGNGYGTISGDISGNTFVGQFSEIDGDNATFTMTRQPI